MIMMVEEKKKYRGFRLLGIILALLCSLPFIIYFQRPFRFFHQEINTGWPHPVIILDLLVTLINALSGSFFGNRFGYFIKTEQEGKAMGMGVLCGLLIGLLTGTVIFPVYGTIIGIVIGPILGLACAAVTAEIMKHPFLE